MSLAPQSSAAAEAFTALEAIGRPGCLIGGLALQRWGEPRMTQDADLTVIPHRGLTKIGHDRILDGDLSTEVRSPQEFEFPALLVMARRLV